jgi:hypothetical protein
VGRMQFPWPDPLSQSCRYLPPPPNDRYWWHRAAAARGMWVFHLSCSSHHLNSPIILWFSLPIAFGWGEWTPMSDPSSLVPTSFPFELKKRGNKEWVYVFFLASLTKLFN